jgi:hypothetical protein
MSNELTEAERAVAETLRPFLRGPSEQWLTQCADEASRAIVAAVRPIIEARALEYFGNHLYALVATESFCSESDDSGMKLAASEASDLAETLRNNP